jgi:tetratricopeptide (TPR) repeat protein
LRSTIRWSYDLLQPDEQTLFRRMSAFTGGCTLEAIEAVCNFDQAIALDVLDGVASLVDKSLVRQETTTTRNPTGEEGEPRFGMLETLREYGRELLQSAEPAGGDELYRRHAKYYMMVAEQGRAGVQGPQQEMWLARFEAEHDNLYAAMKWAIDHRDTETALCLGGALWVFSGFRTYSKQGFQWLQQALQMPGAETRNRARATALMGASLMGQDLQDADAARAYIEESISILRELGAQERGELGKALLMYGSGQAISGGSEATRAAVDEGIDLLRQEGNKWDLSFGLFMRGYAATADGNLAAARMAFEESIALSRDVGNIWILSHSLNGLGDVSRLTGDYGQARQAYEESLSLYHRLNAATDIPASLHNLGRVALAQARVEDAKNLVLEALRLHISHKNKAGIAECLVGLAGVAGAEKQPERAARLFGAAEALREASGALTWPAEQADYESNLQRAQSQVDEATWQQAWQQGRAMTIDQATSYALEESTTLVTG